MTKIATVCRCAVLICVFFFFGAAAVVVVFYVVVAAFDVFMAVVFDDDL